MPQPNTTDNLNEVLKNLARNRVSAVAQRDQLQKQLDEMPAQIQASIDSITKGIGEIDAITAAIQVTLTDSNVLAETERQIVANASPLSPAAAGGDAAGESGATETAVAGDAGSAGVADQPAAADASAAGAQDAQSEVAAASA